LNTPAELVSMRNAKIINTPITVGEVESLL
jgi:hypothetical protein